LNRLELQTRQTMRTMMIGLSIALFAFGALGIANPRPVHADYSSSILQFYCEYSGVNHHPQKVYVEGYNQNYNWVQHQFPSYYTWDGGNYWYWMNGRTVYYFATYNGVTDWSGQSFYVSGRSWYDSAPSHVC
jgi:hypothetical protein